MTAHRAHVPARLERLADAVLLPCFDGLVAPEWVRRRVGASLGGVCLFARNVTSVDQVGALSASLVAERDSVVISIDEEAGDVTRLDAATGSRFPGAFALGRVDGIAITERIAMAAGTLMRSAGISLNLAPCADVTLDLDNPVIGSRSFGTDPDLVARHTAAWVRGQQSAGVATCAKHFPGHGDTNSDSHRAVAVLTGDVEEIRRSALPPFAAAIEAGTAAIMPGHLLVPAIDDVPATVSATWLIDILRGELGFTGTVVTDALEMAGVASQYGIRGAAVRALKAGADLLCIGGETRPPEELDTIRDAIVDAVIDGTLSEERLADAADRSARVGIAAVRGQANGRARLIAVEPVADRESIRVAARAIEVVGDLPPLGGSALVIRCGDTPNIAVGVIPWGPAMLLPGSVHEIVLGPGDDLESAAIDAAIDSASSVLVVTRDRHRFSWMRDAVASVRRRRSEAVVMEMGISGVTAADAPAIATFGATLAAARAAVGLWDRVASTA